MPPKSRGQAGKGKAVADSNGSKGPRKKGHVARQNELTQHAVVDDDIGQMANLFELIESPWTEEVPNVPGLISEEADIDDMEEAMDDDAEDDPSLTVDKAWELFPGWRPGMEEEFQSFQDEAYGATGVGKEKRGKIRRGRADMPLSAEVRALLGQSNDHYVRQETDEAIRCLQQVIQIDANVHKAWNTLGLIYTELGDDAKALQAYLVAAHLQPKNAELWKKNAYLCGAVGDKKQQIYCLSQAIKADNTDLDAIWDRSKLYAEVAQYKRAIDGFKGLLEQLPYDMNVVKELADVYNKQGQVSEAVSLFENAFRHYRQGPPQDTEGSFGFAELMFMADLYINERRHSTAIDTMRKGIRWLQDRGPAVEWDRLNDDREFDIDDSRRKNDKEISGLRPGDDFPIDLRVALGICRLKLHQPDEAKRHFAVAYKYHGSSYRDLFFKIGNAFLEEEMWDDAISVFLKIDEDGEFETETVKALAQCYRHLNDTENAIKCYQLIIENEPNDLRTKMALAELYEDTNEEAKAMELVKQVIAQQQSASHSGLRLSDIDEEMLLGGSQVQAVMRSLDAADDKNKKRNVSKRAPYDPNQERAKEEETRLIFAKVKLLKPRVLAGDEEAKVEYLREARSLVEEFMSIRSLFPHDRKKHFTGVRQYVRKTANLDGEAAEMAGRLQRTMENQQQGFEVAVRNQQEAQYLRTVLIDDWLDALWSYSWVDASQDKEGGIRAVNLLKHLSESAVVYNSRPRTNTNLLVIAACAAINKDVVSLAHVARTICHLYQFRSSGYQLFNALLSQGSEHIAEYQDGRHQKYIRRQQREMVEALVPSADSARERAISTYRRRSRSDSIDSAEDGQTTESLREAATAFAPTKKNVDMYDLQSWNAHLSLLYGNIMMAARSHPLALTHFLRAYAAEPRDPLVCFSVGSAYIHRAMMRNSEDRQYQIMQGFTFLFRYFDLRKGNQEAHYNLGRAFHQLSLFHHAVSYYEKVIKMSEAGGIDDDEDLVREAAFNLFQIYVASSNVTLADDIMTKYLCV